MKDLMTHRWDWLSLSIALHTLASIARWLVDRQARTAASANAWWSGFQRILQLPWLSQGIRMLYGLGLPAAALMWQGTLTSYGLGLRPFDRELEADVLSTSAVGNMALDTGQALLVAVGVTSLFACGRWLCRALPPATETPPSGLGRFVNATLDALYHQAHWAFYREPFVITAGLTAGSWLGLIPVAAETMLNISLWERLDGQTIGARQNLALRAALWVAGTLIFIHTRNLGLAILVHAIVSALHLSREQETA